MTPSPHARYFYEIRLRVCQIRGIPPDEKGIGNISAVETFRAWNMLKGFWKRGSVSSPSLRVNVQQEGNAGVCSVP